MKTLIKITVLITIAALAAVSCAPEVELTSVDWDAVKAGNNADNNTAPTLGAGTSITFNAANATGANMGLGVGVAYQNQVVVTFHAQSDFLRNNNSDLLAKMQEFLTFHGFTSLGGDAANNRADELLTAIPYTFVNRNDTAITVKLNTTFAEDDSNVVMKVDGTKYTFASGNKMDRNSDGISGEAIYDDFYTTTALTVAGLTGTPATAFFAPGNKEMKLTLSTPAADTKGIITKGAAVATLDYGTSDSRLTDESKKRIGDALVSSLKIQVFKNGGWSDATAVEIIHNESDLGKFVTKDDFDLSDTDKVKVPYRVIWKGATAPLYAFGPDPGTYFGVKQKIRLVGENAKNNSSDYQLKVVYGKAELWYDTAANLFAAKSDSLSMKRVYSQDSHNKNLVIDMAVAPFAVGPETYGLHDYKNEKQKFIDNFKIAYLSNPLGGFTAATGLETRTDVSYIPITDVEFLSEDAAATADPPYINVVRITLDPGYKLTVAMLTQIFLYINSEIYYANDSDSTDDTKITYGSEKNFMTGFWGTYALTIIP